MSRSCRYKFSTAAQSVLALSGAEEWQAAMAACSWYGPGGPCASAPSKMPWASPAMARSQSESSLYVKRPGRLFLLPRDGDGLRRAPEGRSLGAGPGVAWPKSRYCGV